jgi:hypothetical protein
MPLTDQTVRQAPATGQDYTLSDVEGLAELGATFIVTSLHARFTSILAGN